MSPKSPALGYACLKPGTDSAALFGVGTIVSLIGTGFIVYVLTPFLSLILRTQSRIGISWGRETPELIQRSGFKHQFESAFKLKRLPATIILLAALIMTFVAAFVLPSILCIIFVIVRSSSRLQLGVSQRIVADRI